VGEKEKEPIYYLGGGSNLLIADEGLPGLVIRFANREAVNLSPRFSCGAGASLAYVISLTRSAGLSGLEWGFGIPQATIGGCIRGNAGGFGMDTASVIETVEHIILKKIVLKLSVKKIASSATAPVFLKMIMI